MNRAFLFVLPIAATLAGCQTVDEMPSQRVAVAGLRHADGTSAGTAQLFSNGGEMTISIALSGIAAGTHGMHLHTTGRCEGPDFASAGPHLNPGDRQHGTENPAGSHLGDLPNVTTGPAGTGSASAVLPGAPAVLLGTLFDADGTAVVVHASADDYRTDPSGSSGNRIACGVLSRP
jgi:Cu-Zn family superoxide dismutase